jgi:hypothetical protein
VVVVVEEEEEEDQCSSLGWMRGLRRVIDTFVSPFCLGFEEERESREARQNRI